MTTYYVQRTLVQIIEVEAENPEMAEELAIDMNWNASIDTEIEYLVLDAYGLPCY